MKRIFYNSNGELYVDYSAIWDMVHEMGFEDVELEKTLYASRN